MHEKMTDEDLNEAKRAARAGDSSEADWTDTWGDKVFAHIAALTTERDEARREREQFRDDLVRASEFAHQGGTGSPVTREGQDAIESIGGLWNKADTLRERVQALEGLAYIGEHHFPDQTWKERHAETLRDLRSAESRLAAIRQRAGDEDALGRACAEGVAAGRWDTSDADDKDSYRDMAEAVARYIVGDDATAQEEPSEEEVDPLRCAGCSKLGVDLCPVCDAEVRASQDAMAATEPTTAEAFATVCDWMDGAKGSKPSERRAYAALSLLERRMGAMERELRMVESDLYNERFATAEGRVKDLLTALTDAPPVFTMEEVEATQERLKDEVPNPGADYLSGWLDALDTFRQELTVLRRKL